MGLNFVVLGFIVLMIYWWSLHGLFRALLHLGAVVAAGSIALGLWEPVATLLLGTPLTDLAWGVGLLLPFVVVLLVIRIATDTLVPGNLEPPAIANWIGGGVVGLIIGVLSAGLLVIGLGHMKMGPSLWGYHPLVTTAEGELAEASDGHLWIPVDRQAAGFFTGIGAGAFRSGARVDLYLPASSDQRTGFFEWAQLLRLGAEPESSRTATSEAVDVESVVVRPTPLGELSAGARDAIGEAASQPGARVVVVTLRWSVAAGIQDADSKLRVLPEHIRLVTWRSRGSIRLARSWAPSAVIHSASGGAASRSLLPLDRASSFPMSAAQQVEQNWIFVLDDDRADEWEPRFLFARRLRLELPDANGTVESMRRVFAGVGVSQDVQRVEPTLQIRQSESLLASMSKLEIQGLDYDEANVNLITEGEVRTDVKNVGRGRNAISGIAAPPGLQIQQVQMNAPMAHELFGAAPTSDLQDRVPVIVDQNGTQWRPSGFQFVTADREQTHVKVLRGEVINAASEMPITRMRGEDQLVIFYTMAEELKVRDFGVLNPDDETFTPVKAPES